MMSTSTRSEMLCIALSDDYFIGVLISTFIQQGMSIEGQLITLPPAIQVSSETWFNCSQNPLIGFFKVDFDVCAFFRTQALGLQVKLLFGSLLSLATSIFRLVLVISVYQFTVENLSGCNRLYPLVL
ncbi:hypothetical protein F2Q70_00030203 [Brassica cretica]|uniref:Uncharacterized protein n=1 Tax=Brassica cretica TaxID=69181 RepID=A0A3N6S8P0_BRACR|nr:hypothetical protein F2Q70_00030203 [Brassica cretica]KAF3591972.1 hypothetical protein DY000_02022565 [Brassica cretica]